MPGLHGGLYPNTASVTGGPNVGQLGQLLSLHSEALRATSRWAQRRLLLPTLRLHYSNAKSQGYVPAPLMRSVLVFFFYPIE